MEDEGRRLSQGARIGISVRAAVLAIALAVALAVALAAMLWPVLRDGNDAQVVQGRAVYANNCAACHGADLEGAPDWQVPLADGRMPAPPHDASGHTWHHSDTELRLMVEGGMEALVPGYESDMPAFGGILSPEEIDAVLAYIKSTWPRRERQYQAERSSR
jgi:mono/diheme cytochrome c family protein